MRVKRFLQNMVTGVGGMLLTYILQFVSRTVFIYTLGKEYLGISGLFTNIISVLNVTELGLGAAIVFSLYQPLAVDDKKKITSIIQLLRRAYFFIGLFVLAAGIVLIPFLPFLMKKTTDLVNIPLIFILYVLESVSSYWFYAYKSLIFRADQKGYITNLYTYFAKIIISVCQIVILFTLKSYVLYTVAGISVNILSNLLIARRVDRAYPFLKEKAEPLPKAERTEIYKNVIGTAAYKINDMILRSTDNIIISAFISVASVGVYDNYHMISSSVFTFIRMLFGSATAGVGNYVVKEDKKQSEFLFRVMMFASFWLFGFATICLWMLYNPFIALVWGEEYLLRKTVVAVIVIEFVIKSFQVVTIIYKDACGLFWKGKYRPVATVIINLMVSLLLVQKLGILGVVLGTITSRLLTTWWFEPWLIYRNVFEMSCKMYFVRYFCAVAFVAVYIGILELLARPFAGVTFLNLGAKGILCLIVPNFFTWVFFRRSEEFIYLKNMVIGISNSVLRYRKRGKDSNG